MSREKWKQRSTAKSVVQKISKGLQAKRDHMDDSYHSRSSKGQRKGTTSSWNLNPMKKYSRRIGTITATMKPKTQGWLVIRRLIRMGEVGTLERKRFSVICPVNDRFQELLGYLTYCVAHESSWYDNEVDKSVSK